MRTASAPACISWTALLALLLALRLLSPAGFMPQFDRGAVTIIACPDASGPIIPAHHHHSADHRYLHQPCPYGAASALGAIMADFTFSIAPLVFGAVRLLRRPLAFIERRRANERPYPTGPPIPA